MDPVKAAETYWYVKILSHAAFIVAVLFFCVFVGWLVTSRPNAKLYEADNVVCVSQPFSSNCFERTPR